MSQIEQFEEQLWQFEDSLEAIESEADMQAWWIEFLRYNKWTVESEVSPRGSSNRADLIIQRGHTPPIGIELKYEASGRDIGQALHQITDKYRNRHYPGFGFVNLWGLSVLNSSMNPKVRRPVNNEMPRIRELFCVYGIGTVGVSLHPAIDFSYSDRRCKVGLGDAKYPGDTREAATDFEAIEEKVASSVGGCKRKATQSGLSRYE